MNTSLRLTIEGLRLLVDAASQALLVADRSGCIVCTNEAARSMLGDSSEGDRLGRLFLRPDQLDGLLSRAARTSGGIPHVLTPCETGIPLRVTAQALERERTGAVRLFLLTMQTRAAANDKMLALKLRLDSLDTQYRQVLAQKNALEETVSQRLPQLEALSYEDPLTGLKNRRYFDRQFLREWNRSLRRSNYLSLICIDIDRFKDYNDVYGHPAGDQCLRLVAGTLAETVAREFDSACRIGGEEFAMLLPMTDVAGAIHVARHAVDAIRGLALPHAGGGVVTISAGVGTCQPQSLGGNVDFHKRVDAALYRAKAAGRDRFVALSPVVPHIEPNSRAVVR